MDFDIIRKFKNQRDEFTKIYTESLNIKKLISKSHKKNIDEIFKNGHLMNNNELLKYGEHLDEEYEKLKTNKIDQDLRGYNDVPIALRHAATEFAFEKRNFEYQEQELPEEKHLTYSSTAKENVKNEYYRSIEKITSLGIEIWNIEKNLMKFKNRTSMYIVCNTTVYKFYCKKNNYKFVIKFIDDCDCEPGLLLVEKVIDTRTNNEILIRCDLYCQNTSIYELKNFTSFIESESVEDFVNRRYPRLKSLLNYLEEKSFIIKDEDKKQLSDQVKLLSNDSYLNFRISTERGDCILVLPKVYDRMNGKIGKIGTGDYIFVGPNIEEYNSKQKTKHIYLSESDRLVKIGHNEFNFGYKTYCLSTELDESKSNEQILELFTCYFDVKEGKIGYNENGKYYNDKEILRYFNCPDDESEIFPLFQNYSDYYNGPIIGIVLYMYPECYEALCAKNDEILYDVVYPYDKYKLTFRYEKGESKCKLSVEFKCRLINMVAREFYKTGNLKEIVDSSICQTGKYDIEGSFTEIFEEYKKIITTKTSKNIKTKIESLKNYAIILQNKLKNNPIISMIKIFIYYILIYTK